MRYIIRSQAGTLVAYFTTNPKADRAAGMPSAAYLTPADLPTTRITAVKDAAQWLRNLRQWKHLSITRQQTEPRRAARFHRVGWVPCGECGVRYMPAYAGWCDPCADELEEAMRRADRWRGEYDEQQAAPPAWQEVR